MKTAFVLIDLQEKFKPVIRGFDEVVSNCSVLVESAKILNIPLIVTEQYSKGLGKTVIETSVKPIEKMEFSCYKNSEFREKVKDFDRLVLFGIEAHVCVMQTALDLVKDKKVIVVADAIGSRKKVDYKLAIKRYREKGVDIVSTEMILFELLEKAGTEKFKKVQKLIK